VIRNEGLFNTVMIKLGLFDTPLRIINTDAAVLMGMTYVYLPLMVLPLLGGGKNMMIGNFIELQFLAGRNWPLGAALSVTLLVIVTVALLFYVRAANRGSNPHG